MLDGPLFICLLFVYICGASVCEQVFVGDVRKWIVDVGNCLNQSSVAVDGVDGLQCELRESRVGS